MKPPRWPWTAKPLSDHLRCIVSLVEHKDGAPVALIAAPNKGHELPAAQKLLRGESQSLAALCALGRRPLPPAEPERGPRPGAVTHALAATVLRGGWGPTKTVFERVAARPSHGLEPLAKPSFR